MSSSAKLPTMMSEDIVIAGISGRFPESDSSDEFAYNLYNGVNMITTDSRRWPTELYGMDSHMAKIKEIDKFDGTFFGIMGKMSDSIEPQSRLLLETTYEAIIDSGINPQSLRGSETGVYIGYSSFGMPDGIPDETQPDSQSLMTDTLLWMPGNAKCLYANRVSFVFDFKGPSIVMDTACSSSMVALNVAINDLRLGVCDQAVVGGTNVNLQPFTNHIFQSTRLNSEDGIPKVWDQSADGFTRGEAVITLFLQRRSNAKRIYANVLSCGVNIDGNKRMGMFYPSAESQEELMIKTYKKADIDPLQMNYFEAHATGTKVGDPQEAKAIYNAYCIKPGRQQSLPIGLLKSVVGHGEGASGVTSIIKVLIAYENECIPHNKNLVKIKSNIEELSPPLVPINENLKYTPGIAGVNNFGVGGVNGHVLLEPNYKVFREDSLEITDTIPRLVNICCRTEEAFNQMCEWIEKNPNKISRDFLALLTDTMKVKSTLNSTGFPIRGSMFIKKTIDENNANTYDYKKQFSTFNGKTFRPVWFLFPGLGGQWVGMAKALMPIKIFAKKVEECHEILKPFGIDLKQLLLSEDKNSMSSMTNKFCATTALEIALFDVMKALNIIPDGIIGHSFGEIACAYADNCLTTKEALLVTYYRGVITESDKKVPKGLMAVVGMSWDETKKICPKGVNVVCNNGKNTVVISGKYKEMREMIESLTKKSVFVRELESSQIPYHSLFLNTCATKMREEIKKIIFNPKLISEKWISTSVLDTNTDEDLKYASAEYFVHNLISPVHFYSRLNQLPENAIIVELGPHSLFAKTITQTLELSTYMSLIKKDSNDTNLDMFLGSIAKLYELGLNPDIENLYPKIEWPVVRGTQSIASLMKWDHNYSHFVRKYPDYYFRSTSSDFNETIDLSKAFKSYLPDHKVDNNVLFPATGYLMLAWRQLAAYKGRIWNQIPVVFEDVQFRRPVFLSDTEPSKLKVIFHPKTGDFVVLEHNNETCVGRMKTSDEDVLSIQNLLDEEINNVSESEITIETKDIYKDLRVMGYDYGINFQRLKSIETEDFKTLKGEIEWDGNWVTFMDGLFHISAVALPFRKLMVPVMIKRLKCNPKILYEYIAKNKIEFVKEEVDEEKEIKDAEEGLRDGEVADILETNNAQYLDQLISDRFHYYKSVLPFHVDMNSRLTVTHGIEVEELIAIPIPRKLNIQDLKLESYQFMANEDMNAIEESERDSVLNYIKICSSLALQISEIYLKNNTKTQINKISETRSEDQIMLKILDKIIDSFADENENINFDTNSFEELLSEIQINPEFDMSLDVINQFPNNEHLFRSLLDIVSENNVPKKEIKVLEINLSNGLMGKEVDNYLASSAIYPIDVNYTIAVKTIDSLHEDFRNKSFKLIEWDYEKTVFPSDISATDLIILKDSQELWDLKLEDQLKEINDSLMTKGFLIAIFKQCFTEPELTLNSLNGKKYLKNSDLKQRIDNFITTANKSGFCLICHKFNTISSTALLFRKIDQKFEIPDKKQIIKIDDNIEQWFDSLKQLMNNSKESVGKVDNIWLIGNNSDNNGLIGFVNCLRLEPGGEAIRCVFDCDYITKYEINFNEKPFSDILANDLAINMLKNGKTGTFRHLTLPKDYDKIQSNEYFLNVGHNRDLSTLQWFDSKNMISLKDCFDLNNRKTNRLNVQIYSSGLNFKDVMFATGRIISGPLNLFTDCVIGFEFAGRRSDTGVRVMGFDMSRCFATSIDAIEKFLSPIPDHWSMDDAVSVLVVYSTVWYGLIERAQMRRNESILIHSGAGGVGQAAINVCKYYNCDIFVTVGTEDKKKFLMNEYNIPENRIFSSRDIQFKYKIKSATKGKGVDLVLNSLTGDKLEASYECVADCGRFVEIGKYDLQMNKQLGMFSFLRDISFIGVSVDQKLYLKEGFTEKFFDWMHNNCNNGMIKPINRTVFRAEEAEKAFRYMTTGKHIGKIVIKIRDEESDRKPMIAIKPAMSLKTTTKTYFNPNKVYIITGGLGGFGLELVHSLLFLGARKFVLTSRYGLKTDYQKYILQRLKSLSNEFKIFDSIIIVSTHDSNTIKGSKELIEEANKLGPIGGVFHLALVLNDCLLENQSIDKFKETIDSKTKTFENLDKISRELDISFDYFVVFSSVSCGKGNSGQSNYGYANSVCERICEQRRRDGLHGLAIQWGPIDDVGVIADINISNFSGISKQRINSCLDILEKLLQNQNPILSCFIRAKRMTQSGSRESKIVNQIWQALGIDPKTTPDHLTLGEIGMESMFAVELQQGLERDYNIKLTLNDIKNITIKHMKDFEAGKVEELKKFAEDVRKARERLAKIKFIIPTEPFTRLNNVKTGVPVYFLPPIEGIFTSLEGLAEKINRPVIGLNWTKGCENLNSLKDIAKYYTNLLNSLHPNGNYDIVGHSYSSLITMKMLKRAPIGRAVIIDMLSEVQIKEEMLNDDYLLEMILKIICKDIPIVFKDKLMREVKLKTDINAKISKIGSEMREFVGRSMVNKDLDDILLNSFKRAKLFTNYRLKVKNRLIQMKRRYFDMKSNLLIIKPSKLNAISAEDTDQSMDKIKDTYFLSEKIFEDKLKLETVDESGDEMAINITIAEKINKYFIN